MSSGGEPLAKEASAAESNSAITNGTERISRRLYSGHALTETEGNSLAAAERTYLVALVGPIKSGKTTLALSIFEEFRQGNFCDQAFAGSRTLLGFEERAHLSRAASEKQEPETERTKSDAEEVLLHLRVCSTAETADLRSLIFCDLSGELFEAAGASTEALLRIPYLKGANHVAMFIDGAGLLDAAKRHSVRQEFLTLLRAAMEAGIFSTSTNVSVVFSKQDIIQSSSTKDDVKQYQDQIEAECRARFADKFRSLSFHRVASRPTPNDGLSELFKSWLAEIEDLWVPISADPADCVREIDLLGPPERLKLEPQI